MRKFWLNLIALAVLSTLVIGLILAVSAPAAAQYAVPAAIGAPYGCDVTLTYDPLASRVLLTDATGHTLTVVEDRLPLAAFESLGLSVDCQYAAATLHLGAETETALWHLASLTRVPQD
jgi:hypothetical protein